MDPGQRLMSKATGTDMWKYLEYLYEGKSNAFTRMNREITKQQVERDEVQAKLGRCTAY